MKVTPTPLNDCFLVTPTWYPDDRGGFMVAYNAEVWTKTFPGHAFIQDNLVHSKQGVIRGMHFQKAPHAQGKLVSVVQGRIKDIVIDLRPESSSYLKTFEYELSAEDKQQLFVPKGFAHGYAVLSEEAVVLYKADAPYFPESEGGIVPTDPFFQLDWGVPKEAQIIHQRDLNWPLWKQV